MKQILFVIFLATSLSTWAQSANDSLQLQEQTTLFTDTLTQGFLEITMDSRIDKLLASEERVVVTSVEVETTPTTLSELCRKYPKLTGYTIRVATTQTRNEINTIRNKFRVDFPNLSPSTDFQNPYFVLLAGEFFKREDAQKQRNIIKNKYPLAIVKQTKISCIKAQGNPFN